MKRLLGIFACVGALSAMAVPALQGVTAETYNASPIYGANDQIIAWDCSGECIEEGEEKSEKCCVIGIE